MSENIKIYKKTEEGYPKNLLQLPDAPSRLYAVSYTHLTLPTIRLV